MAADDRPDPEVHGVWRTPKPVIAQVHGWCVGGGSDFALCADLVIVCEDAVIGTPYAACGARTFAACGSTGSG